MSIIGFTPLEFSVIVVIGLVASTLIVKSSLTKSLGVDVSFFQAAKITLFRSFVGCGAGFILGKGVALAIENNLIDMHILQSNPEILIAVGLVCLIAGLLGFRWIAKRTVKRISFRESMKTFIVELKYLVKIFVILFLAMSVFIIIDELIDLI